MALSKVAIGGAVKGFNQEVFALAFADIVRDGQPARKAGIIMLPAAEQFPAEMLEKAPAQDVGRVNIHFACATSAYTEG